MKHFLQTMALLLASAGAFALQAQPAEFPMTTKTNEVMVLMTAKAGVQREQLLKLAPEEVRATVRLYLEGHISQWYSRSDGKGVILIVIAKNTAEAAALADSLPFAKANLVDHEYTELSPLAPLGVLLGSPAAQPAGEKR